MVTPEFHKQRMRMVWPDRSQITVDSDLWLTIDNPERRYLLASIEVKDANLGRLSDCEVHDGPRAKLH